MSIDYDNSNLLGAPYKEYVNAQIQTRQEKLGNTNKSHKEILWENGKTAYIALASSVDIRNTLLPYSSSFNVPTAPQTDPLTLYILSTEAAFNNDGERRVQALELPGDPEDWFGNYISTQYVLFGGTAIANLNVGTDEQTGNLTSANAGRYRFGVNRTTDEFNSSAYGLGGTEWGMSAMPGITGFNLKSRNMGSLREVTVNIRANNENQFKIIDNLYCRIGYSMFLEWGNSVYFNNEGEYITETDNLAPSLIPTFLTKKYGNNAATCPSTLLKYIEQNRERSNGNYDAFFGRVKNFTWEFNKDGYYDITLSLISWGDIIESLGIDRQYGDQPVSYEEGSNNVQPNNTSALSTFLSVAAEPISSVESLSGGRAGITVDTTNQIFKTTLVAQTSKYIAQPGFSSDLVFTNTSQSTSDTIPSLNYTRLETSIGKIISATAQFGSEKPYFYIRLGDILDFIKDRLLIYHPECNNEPIIDINTNTDTNWCYYSGINVSADPSKVMVRVPLPYEKFDLDILANQDTKFIDNNNDKVDDNPNVADWPYPVNYQSIFSLDTAKLEFFIGTIPNTDIEAGKIMNIYFEYQYLLDTIKQLRNEKTKKLPLFDFITELCNTANSVLGGVNKLSVRLKNDNILQIYDQNTLYGLDSLTLLQDDSEIINLYGFQSISRDKLVKADGINLEVVSLPNYKAGSFVTDFSIKTELTNEFSTTVAIGAQAQGQVIGEDATGLSKWNYGLVDRFYPSKIDSLKKEGNVDDPTISERINRIRKNLKFLWLGYAEGNVIKNAPTSYTNFGDSYYFEHFQTERYSEFVKLQQDYLQEVIKFRGDYETSNFGQTTGEAYYGNSNQIGMLPINIQITMDGLSGIRIYDQLGVDVRFIPNYYPQALKWIIKGVSHEIVNNKWFTKLDTIAVPRLPKSMDLASFIRKYPELTVGLPDAGPSGQNATGGNGSSSYNNSPLAKKLISLGRTNGNLAWKDMSFVGVSGGKLAISTSPSADKPTITLAYASSNAFNTWNVTEPISRWSNTFYMPEPALIKLRDLARMASKANVSFTITSIYRSYAAQDDVKKRYGDKAASPGSSPHGWGGAIDIGELYTAVGGSTDPSANAKVRANNPLYLWLEINGPKVGWINPSRLADGAGKDECWHWEWWGDVNLDLLK